VIEPSRLRAEQPRRPGLGAGRLLIPVAVMSATLMQVLDTTIVNVALPYPEHGPGVEERAGAEHGPGRGPCHRIPA
jgi:hypothetical protein